MNEIIEILMRRDGISRLEAENLVDECLDEMYGAFEVGDYLECEEILKCMLGLEPDYLELLLW